MVRHLCLLLLYISFAWCRNEYCSLTGCGNEHVGCRNARLAQNYGIECPKDAYELDMKKYKSLILKAHNALRNTVAGGIGKLLPAVRVAEMAWNDELAYLASLNVRACEGMLDICRSTTKFRFPGQNVHHYSTSVQRTNVKTDKYIIEHILQTWANQAKLLTNAVIEEFPAKRKDVIPIEHVSDMIHERGSHVGCAAVRFTNDQKSHLLLTCNYASGHAIGEPLYTTGDRAASACKKGASKVYSNLCAVGEEYEHNTP